MANSLSSIAIIPDGNRRFSAKAGLPIEAAYAKGFEKSQEAVAWSAEAGVKSLTFWALSLENYSKRSQFELAGLFSLMKNHAQKARREKAFSENGVRVKFFGKLELLPKDLLAEISALEESTRDNGNTRLNVALAYSGRDELLNAAKKVLQENAQTGNLNAEISEEDFSKHLYLQESPDLIIRTGNVQRLSGFLPWQAGYSEIYFSPKLWPEFQKQDFAAAVEYYNAAERRFGK
ncbi:MAG: polyprenyl diphosphate synthase [Candidatus Micrarchaeia archaeon]|jgi:undecaprenyl diphosphate synthase